jgi:hypothetical protein
MVVWFFSGFLFALPQVWSQEDSSNAIGNEEALQLVPVVPTSASEIHLIGMTEIEGVDQSRLWSELGNEQTPFKSPCYYRLDFGDPQLAAVIIMQDESDPHALYVDANRDSKFQASERYQTLAQTGQAPTASERIWLCDILLTQNESPDLDNPEAASSLTGSSNFAPIQFRQLAGNKLAVATAANLQGAVIWSGHQCQCRVEDRNANGRWFDPNDRLFVDLNRDGRLDPLLERLPAQGMRRIDDELVAIGRSDDGRFLRLEIVKDRGFIKPELTLEAFDDFKILSADVVFASSAGIQMEVKNIESVIEVPIGWWSVHSVRVEIEDGDQVYSFSFYQGARSNRFEIRTGETKPTEVLGNLELAASVSSFRSSTNQQITITPSLTTETGLFLRQAMLAKKGQPDSKKENRLTCISSAGGEPLGLGSSGFS